MPLPCPPHIRFFAFLYDCVVLVFLLFLAIFLYQQIGRYHGVQVPVFGRDIGITLYCLAIVALFYGYFWSRTGQTIGMRTWRVQLLHRDGTRLRFIQALNRLAWAWMTPGIGWLWMWFNNDRHALYDILARTQLVRLPK